MLAILLALLLMMSGFALADGEQTAIGDEEGVPLEDVTEPYEEEESDLPGAEENIDEQAAPENSFT